MTKISIKMCMLLFTIYLNIPPCRAQVTTYTINATAPASATNFQSFTSLINNLTINGVSTPVVVNVVPGSGPYHERIVFTGIPGTSPSNTIRINGNGETVTYTTTASERQLLTFSRVKYLAIADLTFKTSGTSYCWGAWITDKAAFDSIINCDFNLTSTMGHNVNSLCGITFSQSANSVSSSGQNGHDCYIGYNHILFSTGAGGAYYGILIYGSTTQNGYSANNIIVHNKIENFYRYGIAIRYAPGTQLLYNNISRATKTQPPTTFHGIYVRGNNTSKNVGTKIIGNRIHAPYKGNGNLSSYSFTGIDLLTVGTSVNPVLVANNVIYNINVPGDIKGIYAKDAQYVDIYSNTIHVGKNLTGSNNVYGLYISNNTTGIKIKNNNVSITKGGSGNKYGFYYESGTGLSDAQQNNFYVQSNQGTDYYGYMSGTAYNTVNDFRTAHPTLEINSPTANPKYISPSAGDFHVRNNHLINKGEDLSPVVPKDINLFNRPTNPTIGAFEYTGYPLPLIISKLKGHTLQNNLPFLTWKFLSEDNITDFEIQRSENGKTFYNVGTLAFKGIGQSKDYHFKGQSPILNESYFRLTITKRNHHKFYSNIVMLFRESHNKEMRIYPNPVKNSTLLLSFPIQQPLPDAFALINYSGRLIFQRKIVKHIVKVNVSAYPRGVYFIEFYKDGILQRTKKIVIN